MKVNMVPKFGGVLKMCHVPELPVVLMTFDDVRREAELIAFMNHDDRNRLLVFDDGSTDDVLMWVLNPGCGGLNDADNAYFEMLTSALTGRPGVLEFKADRGHSCRAFYTSGKTKTEIVRIEESDLEKDKTRYILLIGDDELGQPQSGR